MKQQNLRVVITLMLSFLCWVPGVWAEPYIAAYAGFSLLSDTDLNADLSFPGAPALNPNGTVSSTIQTIRGVRLSTEVDDSAIFGGKIGYWFDFFPLVGAELDVYGFNPDITVPSQRIGNIRVSPNLPLQEIRNGSPFRFDVSVTTVGINLMGRYPLLKNPAFPRGRIQPYIGIGPALFITSIEDLEPDSTSNTGSKTLTYGGLQVIGGLKFFLLKKLSLFVEYKFSHFTADLSGVAGARASNTNTPTSFSLSATQNIDANHFYGGVAYHFY